MVSGPQAGLDRTKALMSQLAEANAAYQEVRGSFCCPQPVLLGCAAPPGAVWVAPWRKAAAELPRVAHCAVPAAP